MTPSDVKATLSFSDGSPNMELPIYKGTIGPDVIDIRKLYAQTGKFTYDPGFLSTAACQSAITYIDRDKREFHDRAGLRHIIEVAGLPPFPEVPYRVMDRYEPL